MNLQRREFLERTGQLFMAGLLAPFMVSGQVRNKIKVGVIGCGSVSGMYLPHLRKSEFVELVSVCDIIPERTRKAATTYQVPNQFSSIESMLAGPAFDLIVNLTNMQEHGRLNRIALNAGRHVWSEKPLANSYAEGRELVDFATQRRLKIWGAPAVVNSPQFAFMAQAIRDGKIGKVAAAHAHYGHLGPTWSAFFYEQGGGSLPDLGVYNIATLTGMLGPAKSLMAMTSIVTPTRKVDDKGAIPVVAEDNAMIIMDHGAGILSHVQCGFNYFDPYGHEGKGQEKPTISIWGTHGNLQLIGYDWAPFGVDFATEENYQGARVATDTGTYVWEQGASVIAENLFKDQNPKISVEHALHVLEIIEKARESQAKGQRMTLESTFKFPLF